MKIAGSPSRCPYCHDSLGPLKDIVACAACGARHHASCYRENGSCASCAATSVLVPEAGAGVPAPSRLLNDPSEGSYLEVERVEDGSVEISWPYLPANQVQGTLLFAALLTPVLGLGLVLLLWIALYRNARTVLTLSERTVRFERTGFPWERLSVNADRLDVDNVHSGSALQVALRGDPARLWVGSAGVGHVLPVRDVEYLQAALLSWRAGALVLGHPEEPPQPEKGGKAPPKRHKA